MVSHEAESRQYSSEKIGTKPKWISMQEMVLPGTIGFDLVEGVEGLGQRQRPETTFNQPIASLWKNPTSVARRELESHDIKTVAGILALSSDEFSSLTTQSKVEERLQSYLEDLTLTPHARLLQAIFGRKQYPIPPDRELELVNSQKVETALSTLREREPKVIKLRFGIETGIIMTLEEIGAIESVRPERVRQIEVKALRKLRHPSRSIPLRDCLSVPPQSFGRQIFGAILSKDLPEIQVEFKEGEWKETPSLKLSQDTEKELRKIFPYPSNPLDESTLRGFLMFDHKEMLENLSAEGFDEIKGKFEGLAIATQERRQQAAQEQASHPVEIFVAPVVNKLLPDMNLTEEQISRIARESIEKLGFPTITNNTLKRNSINTLGDLLRLSQEELLNRHVWKWRDISENTRRLIIDRLSRLIVNPDQPFQGLTPEQIRQDRNNAQLTAMRQLIDKANEEGITSTDEIQKWLSTQMKRGVIFGISIKSWIVKAMIEHVVNHPVTPSSN